jgi:hypothetical protein
MKMGVSGEVQTFTHETLGPLKTGVIVLILISGSLKEKSAPPGQKTSALLMCLQDRFQNIFSSDLSG